MNWPLLRFTGLAFAGYLAYFSALYSEVVFFGHTFVKRDIFRYYYPMWRYAADRLQEGVIPFWNPYHSFGKPFAANIQNCVFYPPQILMHLADFTWAFNFYIFVHLAMAGAFTALYLRDRGLSKTASLTGGLAFAMSGYMASAINLTISLCSAAYFPLALFCWKRAESEERFRWRALLGVVLGLQYLAGDPSIVCMTFLTLAAMTAWKTLERFARTRRLAAGPWVRLAQSAAACAGLTAFHWPMFYEFLKASNRAKIPYDLATMWSVQFNDLVGLVVPFFADISITFMHYMARQSWMDNYYAGVTVVVLAAAACLWRKDRLTSARYVLLCLFGLSLALGRFSGVYWLLNHTVPVFGLIRYPVRFFFVSYFAAACLAAMAVDAAGRRAEFRPLGRRALTLWGGGLLTLSLTVVLSYVFSKPLWLQACVWMHRWLLSVDQGHWEIPLIMDLTYPLFENIRRGLVFLLATLAALFAFRTGRARGGVLACFLLTLVFADLTTANRFEAAIDKSHIEKSSSHVDVVKKDPALFRVFSSPSLFDLQNMPKEKDLPTMQQFLMQAFTPNMLLPHRISDLMGYDSLFLGHTWAYADARWSVRHPARSRYYDLANAKYFVSLRDDVGEPFQILDRGKKTVLYLNPNVLPRAFLVRSAVVEKDRVTLIKNLLAEEFRPLETLYLEEDPGGWIRPEGPEGEGSVSIARYEPEHVEMEVQSPGPRWLFFSDADFPAWKAWVDGRPAPIYRANAAFRAVRVDASTRRVVWKYDTLLFKMGLAASLLTVGLLAWSASRRPRLGH